MLLDDVATYLAAQSTALTVMSGTGGNLLKGVALDHTPAPETLVSLYEAPGFPTVHTFGTSTGVVPTVYDQPGLQVLSRSTSYKTARSNAETVKTILDGYTGTLPTATGRTYLSILCAQPPFLLQRDANNRPVIATNYTVRKTTG